ncbi:22830_t:CDS:2 [Gigaspora rosea]|nr:22830_t:CDS:2 [Gigaspora rosea]
MEDFNEDDDIDLTTYFEGITYRNEDLNNIYNNPEPVPLKESDSFNTFEEAELYVRHSTEDTKVVRKRTILCKHSGSSRPKNTGKQSTSAQTLCLWHINLSHLLKNNTNSLIFVTTFDNEHNHDLSPEAIQFEKNKQFTDEMRKEVEFLVTKYHLGATIVRHKVLMERSKEEQNQKQYKEWKQCIPSTASIVTVFPSIESLVNHYLRPNISHFLVEQMKESLYYTASRSTIEEVESLTVNEPSQSKDIDNEPDAIYLFAKYLLDHLEQNTINEIWKVSRVTSDRINHFVFLLADGSYGCTCFLQQRKGLICRYFYHLLNVTEKAQFSLTLIAARWIPRDKRLDAAKEDSYSGQRFNKLADNVQESNEHQFIWLQLFANNETGNSVNETFVDEVLFYRKVWGLAHTAVNKCMLHHNHAFISLIEAYLEKVRAIEDNIAEQNTTENVESTIVSIENP